MFFQGCALAVIIVTSLPACLSNNQINEEQSNIESEKSSEAICPLLAAYINDELIVPQENVIY